MLPVAMLSSHSSPLPPMSGGQHYSSSASRNFDPSVTLPPFHASGIEGGASNAFAWSPTTGSFLQRANGGHQTTETGHSLKCKEEATDTLAPSQGYSSRVPVSQTGRRVFNSSLDAPLTPTMQTMCNEYSHGSAGMNSSQVMTSTSDTLMTEGSDTPRGPLHLSSGREDNLTATAWQSKTQTSSFGKHFAHWDHNKTPTANMHQISSQPAAWSAQNSQSDSGTNKVYSDKSPDESNNREKTTISSSENKVNPQDAARDGKQAGQGMLGHYASNGHPGMHTLTPRMSNPNMSFSTRTSALSPLTQRPFSPGDLYSLTTPSRLVSSDDAGFPPLKSGGLSWMFNEWAPHMQPFRSLNGHGGPTGVSMEPPNNTVVFTPGGTLKDFNCMRSITPTTSTVPAPQHETGMPVRTSSVVVGNPPLAARAPRAREKSKLRAGSVSISPAPESTLGGQCPSDSDVSLLDESASDQQSMDEDVASQTDAHSHEHRSRLPLPVPSSGTQPFRRVAMEMSPMSQLAGQGHQANGGYAIPANLGRRLQGTNDRYDTEEGRWLAVQRRDPRASAAFFYCVLSTKIFCRTTCPSRHPVRENIIFVNTALDAANLGYRACRRCEPDLEGGDPHEERQEALIAKVKERLYASVAASGRGKTVKGQGLKYIAEELGVSHWHLHRCFKKRVGTTPEAWAKLQAKMIRSSLNSCGGQSKYRGGGYISGSCMPPIGMMRSNSDFSSSAVHLSSPMSTLTDSSSPGMQSLGISKSRQSSFSQFSSHDESATTLAMQPPEPYATSLPLPLLNFPSRHGGDHGRGDPSFPLPFASSFASSAHSPPFHTTSSNSSLAFASS
ncbi:unnamed protein product [Sympodiomycopsis kandeliae]